MKQSTARVASWVYLAEIVNRLVRPLVTLFLARVLSPNDYGVVALAVTFTSAASMVWTLGLPTALIQRSRDIDAAANVTFWLNSLLSSLVYLFLLLASPYIGQLLGDPTIGTVLPIAAITVILDGFSMVHNALLQKQMAFDKLFWRSTLPSAAPLLVATPLAILGYGYWSLIWGIVASSFISNLTLWISSPWRPHWSFNGSVASEMVRFGLPTVGETFQAWFESQADKLVLGLFTSVSVVGTYTVAVTIFALIFNFVFGPIKTVGYARLCRAESAHERKRIYVLAQSFVMFAALPLGIGVAIFAGPISNILLLGKYPGLDLVLQLLAPYYILAGVVSLGIPAMRASGHSYLTLRLNLLNSLLIAILYPIGAINGLTGFLMAKNIGQLIGSSSLMFILARVYLISMNDLWRVARPSIVSTALMGLFLWLVQNGSLYNDREYYWLWWLVAVVVGSAIYVVTNVLQNPQLIQIGKSIVSAKQNGAKLN